LEAVIKTLLLITLSFLMTLSGELFALEDIVFKGEKYPVPVREIAVVSNETGYYPSQISVFAGEKIHFYFTTASKVPSCLMLKDHDLFVSAAPLEIGHGEVVMTKPGVYEYYCPKGNLKGKLTVIAKMTKKERKREVASVKNSVWRPKDDSLMADMKEDQ